MKYEFKRRPWIPILAVLGWVRASAQITAAFTAPYLRILTLPTLFPALVETTWHP